MAYMIGVSGPSGSGKSSVCKALERQSIDSCVERIPMDHFFKIKTENTEQNWDSPGAIKFNELYEALNNLKNDKTIKLPKYSRRIMEIVDEKVVNPKPAFLVEGFMLYYSKDIRDLFDLRIFIDIPKDVQLQRRKKRCEENKTTFDDKYFNNNVYPAYVRYIAPTQEYAHAIVSGTPSIETVTENVKDVINKFKPGLF